jgi:hypothetical protein
MRSMAGQHRASCTMLFPISQHPAATPHGRVPRPLLSQDAHSSLPETIQSLPLLSPFSHLSSCDPKPFGSPVPIALRRPSRLAPGTTVRAQLCRSRCRSSTLPPMSQSHLGLSRPARDQMNYGKSERPNPPESISRRGESARCPRRHLREQSAEPCLGV